MRLKRLKLLGFKSFADRTVMDFGDKTLTGIVGPNGCGKSNVVDAVRWVLGESRPTSLRGSGMTDVIFKGSASRPGMAVAEVTLVLQNDGEIEERGPEIAVTRKLFKDGQGEYLIDGDKVRRKDLRDMLFDTGLGSRGYSVLEQGRIDAVLSANPQQRRAIFEEAAGVSRYRQRRHEAELRLARALQDGERLEDVMGELRSRVRSLKIQAGKAERWVVARDEWTSERRRLLAHRLHEHQGRLVELEPMIANVEQELEELAGDVSSRAQLQLLQAVDRWLEASDESGDCPTPEELYSFGCGPGSTDLEQARRDAVREHLGDCESWSRLVEDLTLRPPLPRILTPPSEQESSFGAEQVSDAELQTITLVPPGPADQSGGQSTGGVAILTASPAPGRRLRAWMPLASAAAALFIVWLSALSRPGNQAPLAPPVDLVRGDSGSSLLFPRGPVLPRGQEGFTDLPVFELAPRTGAESYRVVVRRTSGGAFEQGETLFTLESTRHMLSAGPEKASSLDAGTFSWEAWAIIDGLDTPLGELEFYVRSGEDIDEQLGSAEGPDRVRALHAAPPT